MQSIWSFACIIHLFAFADFKWDFLRWLVNFMLRVRTSKETATKAATPECLFNLRTFHLTHSNIKVLHFLTANIRIFIV